ncbi:hypothetical protein ACHAW6_000332, partial [Cyclotella cf. meneghiniana]
MCIARSFMTHTAFHWSKDRSDEISIWPFAMDHAAWLYNRIPQCMREITPIKMVTSTKFYSCDLMWAHVWG